MILKFVLSSLVAYVHDTGEHGNRDPIHTSVIHDRCILKLYLDNTKLKINDTDRTHEEKLENEHYGHMIMSIVQNMHL